MHDFFEQALEYLPEAEKEEKECLEKIIVEGFSVVPITDFAKTCVAVSYNMQLEDFSHLSDKELVKLGLGLIDEPEVSGALSSHAKMVDEYWSRLLYFEP